MDANFKLGITFLAIDQFSNKFGSMTAKLGKFEQYANNINDKLRNAITPLNLLTYSLGRRIVSDFAETESATIQLKNTMMGAGGSISSEFESVSKKAEELGALLPGTTADFFKMASSMRSLGVGDKSLSSALEATAKMAVVLKPIGVTFEQASEATAKFKNALGIADNDMVKFADTIQRSAHLGANLGEMQYAFSRMAGVLKVMNIQGLEQSNKLTPLVAMLIKVGKTGETVGTSLTKIFSLGIAKKQFSDIEGMFAWLQRNTNEQINKVFGGGDDAQTALLLKNLGLKEYQNTIEQLKNQGSLDERINPSLNTLTNTMEAMGGAMNKLSVSFGKLFAENLKGVFGAIGSVADKVSGLIDQFPVLTKAIGGAFLALMSFSLFKGVGSIFGAIFGPGIVFVKNFTKAMQILNSVQAVNRSLWAVEVVKEYGIAGRGAVLATGAMTRAQVFFNIAANANPYALLITGIASAVGVMAAFAIMATKARTSQELLNDAQKTAIERTMDERAEVAMLFDKLKATNPESKERLAIVKALNDKVPEYVRGMNLEKQSAEELAKSYDKVVEQMMKKARVEAMQETFKEQYKQELQLMRDKQEHADNLSGKNGFWSKEGAKWSEHFSGFLGMFSGRNPFASNAYDTEKNIDIRSSQEMREKLSKLINKEGEMKVEIKNNITFNGNPTPESREQFKTLAERNAEDIAEQIRKQNRGNYAAAN